MHQGSGPPLATKFRMRACRVACSLLWLCRPTTAQDPIKPDGPKESKAQLSHKLDGAAQTVVLMGSTPNSEHMRSLGLYAMMQGWGLTNSKPVYANQDDASRLLWASYDGYWIAGHSDDLGSSDGHLRVKDARAYFVEQVDDAAEWYVRSDDDGFKWIGAPDVQLLHGEEGGAEWKRLQGTVDDDLKRAAERLYLVGSTPQNLRREYVGTFILQSGPHSASNGRHVYHRQGTDKAAMWYDGDGRWRVGSLSNIGTSNSVLGLPGSLALPEESRGVWRVKHPLGSEWLDAPALRILHGEEGRAALKADEVSRQGRVKAAAAKFRLSGETPRRVFQYVPGLFAHPVGGPPGHTAALVQRPLPRALCADNRPDGRAQEYLGEYKRVSGSNINGQPFFTKAGDTQRGLWHALDGNWFAGLIAMQDQFGHARGALRIRTQDATRVPPELGDATWEVWDDAEGSWTAAPQLRHAAAADSLPAAHDEI